MMRSLTSELTIVVKAAPRMIPTARSTTLPRIANSRNSRHMLPSLGQITGSLKFAFARRSHDPDGSPDRIGWWRMSEMPMPAADRYIVVVRNLVLLCSIGVRRVERERLQRVRISVELTATPEASYPREDRRRVINYEKIVTAIRQIARSRHIDLCGGFAERIAAVCFADPRVAHR